MQAVREGGLSEEARELAAAALAALSDRKLQMVTDGQKHVMLSCECGGLFVQTVDGVTVWLMGGRCVSRSMGCAGHDQEDQRVADRARLRHVV